MKHLILILLATALIFAAMSTQQDPLRAVAYVDPNKIVGLWHDYAAIPNESSAHCRWAMTHEFFWNKKNHEMQFRNTCYTVDGKKLVTEGQLASQNSQSLSHFQTSTTHILGHYIYLTSKKYDVIGLDTAYRWMVIGHPSLKLGWIYSRLRELPRRDLMKIKAVLESAGYDSCDFFTFPKQNLDLRQSLCQILDRPHLHQASLSH